VEAHPSAAAAMMKFSFFIGVTVAPKVQCTKVIKFFAMQQIV
jgi:hypothetical protein